MIFYVRFRDVEAHLMALGFVLIDVTKETLIYQRDGEVLTIRRVHGNIPVILVDRAYDAAGLTPPHWDQFFIPD